MEEKTESWPSNKKFEITQVSNVGYTMNEEDMAPLHKTTQSSIAKTEIKEKKGEHSKEFNC